MDSRRTFRWTCEAPCQRKLSAKVRAGQATATRTCQGCRRVWRLDVASGSVRSSEYLPARPKHWTGTSSTGTQGIAASSADLGLCEEAGKFHAVCNDHGMTVCTDSWSRAKYSAQNTDLFCGVCSGDLVEGVKGDLGEMDEEWVIDSSPLFKGGAS